MAKKIILIYIFFLAVMILPAKASAVLTCSVKTSCDPGEVAVLKMSDTDNAHAELSSQSNYANSVCCSGVTGLSNSCSGNFKVVAKLSDATNAHVEQNDQANYANDACLSVPASSSISIGYQANNCTGFDTTVFSMADIPTNSHAGDGSAYLNKVCASASTPPPPPPSGGGGGYSGGGGFPLEALNLPTPPAGGFAVLINNGNKDTSNPTVALKLTGGPNTERMSISNYSDFRNAAQEPYNTAKTWDLCKGLNSCPLGEYKVYVKFFTSWGKSSEIISNSIIYKKEAVVNVAKNVANVVKKTIPAIPPQVLSLGLRSKGVSDLQQMLIAEGFLKINKPNGVFGNLTLKAVKEFQKKYNIPQTGKAGPLTLAKLNERAALPKELKAESLPASAQKITKTLARGQQNQEVKVLQTFLIKNEFLPPENDTGFFGAKTEKALKNFQKTYGLTANGLFGALSLQKMQELEQQAN